ncbi:hypothetical protein [Actinoplanes aureus]|jgi:hypothetical protein|uniref:Uncharacterized protein n=1 Tax=Actinoplanes aureus TaxID=2792083 RepID=A0A931C381_9ACTN|nr:hypothetical protein [Actinoplanes aureus]MBG0562554.1 hypothetical protein [Actinoplanes aureus]
MTPLTAPALEAQPLDLDLEATTVRGKDEEVSDSPDLSGRVFLGGPVSLPITAADADDAGLVRWLKAQEQRYRFWRMHLEVTFQTRDGDPPFEAAAVQLDLASRQEHADPPITWSMAPRLLSDDVEVVRRWQLGPELGLADVTANVGNIGRERRTTEGAVYLEAVRLLRPDAAWEFRRTKQRPLSGLPEPLVAIVRAPVGHSVQAVVSVRATVRERQLFRYRSRSATPVLLSAEL